MYPTCAHGVMLVEDWCSLCKGAPIGKALHSHDTSVCHHGNPIANQCEPCEDECERLSQQEWNEYDCGD
jgi:hypothetical protein